MVLVAGFAALGLGWGLRGGVAGAPEPVVQAATIGSREPGRSGDAAAWQRVAVQAGDTLWALAVRYGRPGGDPRVTVETILERNGLDRRLPLRAGTSLWVPRP